VHGVGIEELVITGTKYNRSKAFFNKGIQSYYLGGSESPRQIKIYDKRAEQRARIKDLSGLNINSSPLVRIEIKLKSLDQSIMDLIALPNPFRPITISRFDSLERGASVEESMFIDSVRYRGAVDAIARLPRKERSRYRAFVRDRNEPWWNPEKLWETWPAPLQSFAPLLMAGDDVLYTNDEEC